MSVTIKSSASSQELIIDPTSSAARTTNYDTRGQAVCQKTTYAAGTTAKTAIAAGTTVFFALYGSSTKTIRVQKITVCGVVAVAGVYGDVVCFKRTSVISGGTFTALGGVALDSNSGTTTASLCNIYTAAPTAGSGGGVIATQMAFMPITAVPATIVQPIVFDWSNNEAESPVLRGTSQGVELAFGTTTTNAPTVTVDVVYTEE